MHKSYKAHIFKQRQVGQREEVKLKLFSSDGEPIDLDGDPGLDSSAISEDTMFTEHVSSETPHPVYDDGPSLALLYENAKV